RQAHTTQHVRQMRDVLLVPRHEIRRTLRRVLDRLLRRPQPRDQALHVRSQDKTNRPVGHFTLPVSRNMRFNEVWQPPTASRPPPSRTSPRPTAASSSGGPYSSRSSPSPSSSSRCAQHAQTPNDPTPTTARSPA